jgi:hypothetical protein
MTCWLRLDTSDAKAPRPNVYKTQTPFWKLRTLRFQCLRPISPRTVELALSNLDTALIQCANPVPASTAPRTLMERHRHRATALGHFAVRPVLVGQRPTPHCSQRPESRHCCRSQHEVQRQQRVDCGQISLGSKQPSHSANSQHFTRSVASRATAGAPSATSGHASRRRLTPGTTLTPSVNHRSVARTAREATSQTVNGSAKQRTGSVTPMPAGERTEWVLPTLGYRRRAIDRRCVR